MGNLFIYFEKAVFDPSPFGRGVLCGQKDFGSVWKVKDVHGKKYHSFHERRKEICSQI